MSVQSPESPTASKSEGESTFQAKPWMKCMICRQPGTRENPLRPAKLGAFHRGRC